MRKSCMTHVYVFFQQLTAGIVYNHPGDPLEFMIEEIERLQEIDRRKKGVIKTTKPATKPQNPQQPESENTEETVEQSS